MFLSNLNRSRRIGWGTRVASYLAAAAAGAVSLALWRRATELGRVLRRTAARPVYRAARPAGSSTNLTNAGWAEVVDSHGSVLGRGRVMLASAGQPPMDGQSPAGELRSLRLTAGPPRLIPGRYWVRFETSQTAHAIEVTPSPSDGAADVAKIRWDDLDLPASLVECDAN